MKDDPHPMDLWLRSFPPPGDLLKEKEAQGASPGKHPSEGGIKKAKHEAVLDLHGMIRADAVKSLNDFIRNCSGKGLRKILVVHGKGTHSAGGAVLPGVVRNELDKNPQVADYGPAEPGSGGGGALWVFLRQRSR